MNDLTTGMIPCLCGRRFISARDAVCGLCAAEGKTGHRSEPTKHSLQWRHGMLLIPSKDLPGMVGRCVHVANWTHGCCFRYLGTKNGEHLLITPKTKKRYHTTEALVYTRKHQTI